MIYMLSSIPWYTLRLGDRIQNTSAWQLNEAGDRILHSTWANVLDIPDEYDTSLFQPGEVSEKQPIIALPLAVTKSATTPSIAHVTPSRDIRI